MANDKPTPTEFLTKIGVTPSMSRHISVTAKGGNKTYTLHELLRDYSQAVIDANAKFTESNKSSWTPPEEGKAIIEKES